MQVKVLGAGCSNCHALEDRTGAALRRLGIENEIEMITDYGEIVAHGVMNTPALVVEDRVIVSGRVPEVSELVSLIGATTGQVAL
jgi:small redox-active disulfide protein 2